MLSSAQLLHLWDEAGSFEQLAAYSPLPVVLDSPDGPVNLFGAAVSPSFSVAAGSAATGPALHRCGCSRGRAPHRVVEPQHPDEPVRIGPGHCRCAGSG